MCLSVVSKRERMGDSVLVEGSDFQCTQAADAADMYCVYPKAQHVPKGTAGKSEIWGSPFLTNRTFQELFVFLLL